MAVDEQYAQVLRENRELRALLREARAALEPLTGAQIKLHRIKLDLADRIDATLDGVLADAPAEQWPRDLSEAEMDELATALNEHDAGSIGFHGLVDRVLAVVRRTAGVKVTP